MLVPQLLQFWPQQDILLGLWEDRAQWLGGWRQHCPWRHLLPRLRHPTPKEPIKAAAEQGHHKRGLRRLLTWGTVHNTVRGREGAK